MIEHNERDLGIDFNSYRTPVRENTAYALAGYIKPLLPKELAVPALMLLDHFWWVDKEMRAGKGRWEKEVLRHLNSYSADGPFKKRKFKHPGGAFELDAAFPETGPVRVGVDVKRFESPRDFHKRGDEITQKVSRLRDVHPDAHFYAVIYYPFPSSHDAVRSRYRDQGIDEIFFADETESTLSDVAEAILRHAGLTLTGRPRG
ncbi:MAG: hypothetical protein ABFS34_07060 [Gemmatimonadota bacterium]